MSEVDERGLSIRWLIAALTMATLGAAAALVLGWILTDLAEGGGPPAAWWARSRHFLSMLGADPRNIARAYQAWFENGLASYGRPPAAFIGAGAVFIAVLIAGASSNPYRIEETHMGSARLATLKDLRRWKRDRPHVFARKRRSMNLLDRGGIVLGRFEGRYIRRAETLTALCLAAPGAGKTTGVAMPTILADGNEDWSLFIYDIKGELYDRTAGWRSKFGPVFRFEPKAREGCRWNPLSPDKSLPGGRRYVSAMKELMDALESVHGDGRDILVGARVTLLQLKRDHHDWKEMIAAEPSQIAPLVVSADQARRVYEGVILDRIGEVDSIQADRENYLLGQATALVPEPPGGGGNAKHFADTGRAALLGMMGFTIARAERLTEKAADERGQPVEPNFGRLIDWWLGDAQQYAPPPGESAGEDDDAIARMLDAWVVECDAYGYPSRYKQELVNLRTKASRERASVISTADTGINIYKTATVRDRTSTSDFALEDIRGMLDENGVSRPVTIYVVVSLEDIKPMAPILMQFTTATQNRLISQPAHIASKSRAVLFILDEFAQIPKMDCLLSGPAVGRGQRVGNLLIAQSYGQIEQTYGQAGRTALIDTSEWKIVFPLTDPSTAQNISNMIGKRTVLQKSRSQQEGILSGIFGGKGTDPFAVNVNESWQGQALFEPSELMHVDDGAKWKPGHHLVLAYTRLSTPILCETPFWFEDKTMRTRAALPAPPPAEAVGFIRKKKSGVKVA